MAGPVTEWVGVRGGTSIIARDTGEVGFINTRPVRKTPQTHLQRR